MVIIFTTISDFCVTLKTAYPSTVEIPDAFTVSKINNDDLVIIDITRTRSTTTSLPA
ncbi:hypothetical protein J4727_03970 [Providencia rettgeri]|uniref:Uncharacterized protein n=1 Tax=Providencia rettgeri TaxID=587 RepID=A0A939NGL4_PRORE|nr:hypothetical protein [Providencia rettgeri]